MEEDWFRIDVADYGLPILKGEENEIFLFGGRGSNAVERDPAGLGIGLYLCREIISLYDGRIVVTRNDNPTILSVLLPKELEDRS